MTDTKPHEGHRARMRAKAKTNISALTDAELVELALYDAIKRIDVRTTAEGLTDAFGSAFGVFTADKEALVAYGLAPSVADALRSVGEKTANAEYARLTAGTVDGKTAPLVSKWALMMKPVDTVFVAVLKQNGRIADAHFIRADSPMTDEDMAERIISIAEKAKSHTVIIAHTHGSHGAVPSSYDKASAERIMQTLGKNGIKIISNTVTSKLDTAEILPERKG